jgi:hypothetical protein
MSVYLMILDQIESRLHSAAEVMLPALRQSLHGFTRRADILLRQLSFSEASQHALREIFEVLAPLPEGQQDEHLMAAGEHLVFLEVGFVDPDHLRLQNVERRRVVDTRAEIAPADDGEARRRLFLEQALERAFAINGRQIHDYLVTALAGGHEVRTSALPMRDAQELLLAAHAIEVGAPGWGGKLGFAFEVLDTGRQVENDLFTCVDEFIVRVVELPGSVHVPG